MKMLLTFFIMIHASNASATSDLDQLLREKIKFFDLKPLTSLPLSKNRPQVELGKRLFMDVNLSGNRNISCITCHDPKLGTSDGLPLSQTANREGILRRNSPALFNLGTTQHSFMFWDGRIHYDRMARKFITPEPNLTSEIADAMTSALSAQALFPMVSREEMRGQAGENEIADAQSNLEAWDKILLRLKNYSSLFSEAYPKVPVEKINIGHVAEAIASFEKEQFQSVGSPFNNYLLGNNNALTEKQKRGFSIFVDQGQCIACHRGSELGNNTFFASVGVPQWGAQPVTPDKGRGEVVNQMFNDYLFRTPSLLNVGLTAPYMHNGAFATLRDVINHYSNIRSSLFDYQIPEGRAESMPVAVEVQKDPARLNEVWKSIQAPFLRRGLNLSESQKGDLEAFLSEALTDPHWVNKK